MEHFKFYSVVFVTQDEKIRIVRKVGKNSIKVFPWNIPVAELQVLNEAGLLRTGALLKIPFADRHSYLHAVKAVLQAAGYDLDTQLKQYIIWVTSDNQYTLMKKRAVGAGWYVQPNPAPSNIGPGMGPYRTRQAAVEGILANSLLYDTVVT